MRTLLETSAHQVWLNDLGVRQVVRAAERTTPDQPFVVLDDPADMAFVHRAVLNVLSEKFAEAFVAQASGLPARFDTFHFAVTCERFADIRTLKIRVLVATAADLQETFAEGRPVAVRSVLQTPPGDPAGDEPVAPRGRPARGAAPRPGRPRPADLTRPAAGRVRIVTGVCPRSRRHRLRATTPTHAEAHRHQEDPAHRLRPDRHRPGVRVRLLRHPGVQGASRGRVRGRPGQLEPGDDHDRPGDGRPDLHRADHLPEVVEKIIAKEKPDALLPTLGGQTALNTAMDLHKHGVLDRTGSN